MRTQLPADEELRLDALYGLRVLDSPSEEAFERIARLAATLLGVPIATLTFVDRDRQWHKACVGPIAKETPRDISFCTHTILSDEPLVIPDATKDSRFASSPLVTADGIRFYAGVPLTIKGQNVGSLCAIDTVPREGISDHDLNILKQLAEVAIDLLELRITHAQLEVKSGHVEEARAIAERANLAKTEFLSRMSHELRTPLNAILGFAQLLAMEDLASDQKQSAKEIVKGGHHLLGLINEVLDISRIEAGQISLSVEPVSARDLIDECISLVGPLATPRGISLASEVDADCDVHILADRQRLKQVILNLLANAVKYNRENGSVRVTCEYGDETCTINVEDTGPGISVAKQALLFVPFERLGAENSAIEGTGLGLALSSRLVDAMGGMIDIESAVGRGSKFSLEFPTVEGQLESFPHHATAAVADTNGHAPKKVLYIEDNPANLRLVERILAHRPWVTLITAMQGGLGLDLASEHDLDLVLIDLNLPDMRGDQVLERLRSDARTADVPAIVLTADASKRQAERLLAAGATSYLTKPLDVEKFLKIVDETLAAEVS